MLNHNYFSISSENFVSKNAPHGSAAANLVYNGTYEINDDTVDPSQGDNDGKIDAGETIEYRFKIRNIGDIDATNVNASINCTDQYCLVLSANQSFIPISSGSIGLSSEKFVFFVNSSCPDLYNLTFGLLIEADQGIWFDNITVVITDAPSPEVQYCKVYSESDGDKRADNDKIVDPGEIITIETKFFNNANANLLNSTVTLSSTDSFINIFDSQVQFGKISSYGTATGRFAFIVQGICPDKHAIQLNFTFCDILNTIWKLNYSLIVNESGGFELLSWEFVPDDSNVKFFEPGANFYLKINLNNTGLVNKSNVIVRLETNSPYVQFSYSESYRNQSIGGISSKQNKTISLYRGDFFIRYNATVGETLTFKLVILDEFNTEWRFTIVKVIQFEFNLIINTMSFKNTNGNVISTLRESDVLSPYIQIRNNGSKINSLVYILIESTDNYVQFQRSSIYRNKPISNINSPYYIENSDWRFEVDDFPEDYRRITFIITISIPSMNKLLVFNQTFTFYEVLDENEYPTSEMPAIMMIGFVLFSILILILVKTVSDQKSKDKNSHTSRSVKVESIWKGDNRPLCSLYSPISQNSPIITPPPPVSGNSTTETSSISTKDNNSSTKSADTRPSTTMASQTSKTNEIPYPKQNEMNIKDPITCPKCGTFNFGHAVYCVNCGEIIKKN